MVTAHDLSYINRVECKDNRECLKCDFKELLERERNDRKEGEIELTTGIGKVENKIDAMNSKLTWAMASFLAGVVLLLLETFMGKL